MLERFGLCLSAYQRIHDSRLATAELRSDGQVSSYSIEVAVINQSGDQNDRIHSCARTPTAHSDSEKGGEEPQDHVYGRRRYGLKAKIQTR